MNTSTKGKPAAAPLSSVVEVEVEVVVEVEVEVEDVPCEWRARTASLSARYGEMNAVMTIHAASVNSFATCHGQIGANQQ